MYYASFGILSMVIHLIINIEALKKPEDGDKKELKMMYRNFLWGVMLYYISDILWGTLYDARIIPLAYADTVLYFLSMVLSLVLWIRFVIAFLGRRGRFGELLITSSQVIAAFEVLVLLVNFFVPIVFGFDENGEYIPGKARYITLAIQILLFGVMSIYTLQVNARVRGQIGLRYRMVGYSGLVMTIFIVLQAMYPLLPFYAIGCLLATCMMHTFVVAYEKAESTKELGSAIQIAYIDSLTSVKNKHAYMEAREKLEKRIRDGRMEEFGVVIFDLNGLKMVNDTRGHDAGDKYIQSACRLICMCFAHSPVYRIGGDEFVAILEGVDYRNRDELIASFDSQMRDNLKQDKVVVSCGLGVFDQNVDSGFDTVFFRADREMYQKKKLLKEMV